MPESPIRKLAPLAYKAEDEGVRIYRLNIGQPDLPTPQKALDCLKTIDRKTLEYSPSQGYMNRIPGCYTPVPMGAFYTVAKLPVKDAEKFCAWCLSEFRYVDEKTPKGFTGETVMMAPASGFYTDPSLGLDQVRLAYVLCKEDLQRAIMILEKAIDQYKVFEEQ